MTDRSKQSAYAAAGVDIDAQDEALARVKERVRATFTDGVLSDVGLFGGLALYYGFLHIIGLSGAVNLPAYILGMTSSTGMLLALGIVLRQILSTRPALTR